MLHLYYEKMKCLLFTSCVYFIIYCSATSVVLHWYWYKVRVLAKQYPGTCSASKYLIENDCEAFLLAALSLSLVLLCPPL